MITRRLLSLLLLSSPLGGDLARCGARAESDSFSETDEAAAKAIGESVGSSSDIASSSSSSSSFSTDPFESSFRTNAVQRLLKIGGPNKKVIDIDGAGKLGLPDAPKGVVDFCQDHTHKTICGGPGGHGGGGHPGG